MNTALKGSKNTLIDQYYESLPLSERYAKRSGQLYFTHVAYPHDWPHILKLTQYDPKKESKSTFIIKSYSEGDERHIPVKDLDLRDNELYYVFKGKKRLIIVLGYIESDWLNRDKVQEVLLCAPVFSFKPRHSQEMVIRIQAFDYPNLFYLPPRPHGCNKESAVRFEMIQPIMSSYLMPFDDYLNKKPVILTTVAYRLLMVHLVKFISNEILDSNLYEDILTWHELLIEEWEKSNIEPKKR